MATVLVTGASGYVGGRLVPALLEEGHEVVCLARTPAKLASSPWHGRVRVLAGEVGTLDPSTIAEVDVAVYLVHSIGQGSNWASLEQRDATAFARACRDAGVSRLVYLGGLGSDEDDLSEHLRSRHEVGRRLAEHLPVVELRAGVIIGSGSASFEMLRYLVEVLPVMVTPRWVDTRCQPLAIADVVRYLVAAIDAPEGIYEVGGPEIVSYAQMMELYARVADLPRRRLLKVPLLTPGLSSHWVGLVTPVPVPLARELVESLVNEVVVDPRRAAPFGPDSPLSLHEAIARALAATEEGRVPTRFVDADLVHFRPSPTDPEWSGGTVLRDVRRLRIRASVADVFAAVCSVGGDNGWYAGEWLWRLRGLADQLVGGPGLRRGRPATIRVGDALDFWRVEELDEGRRLRLLAEMRTPGDARLTWDLVDHGDSVEIVQTALFRPRGLSGRLYWWSVAPFHRFVFPGMLRGIASRALDAPTK